MAKKVIGYQITNGKQDIPNGLYSFQVFKTAEQAFNYLREHKLNQGLTPEDSWFVKEYYEGDIEEPSYVVDDKDNKKLFKVTLYYHTNVTVNVYAESEAVAKNLAYAEVENHTQELLEGLQEDSSPDVCEVDFL